ncbi:hypothetical protein [Williamsia muralis]|uniref:Uncharacterized protein n=1 Tax=Williamsia marianensis TaxID=85044 RepID=A0ABU4EVL7_WILMA|nr:hypothetical protein [Williamsia muralis]MDV7134684.1 hypothetical protein [Williamsia muralis]
MSAVTSSSSAGPRSPLLQVRRIWAEPEVQADLRGQQVLARFPDAEIIDVESHWQIPSLHGNEGNVDRWVRVKTEDRVLGVKKSLTARPNGRSADWIAPSTAKTPGIQQTKRSQSGGINVRYRNAVKADAVHTMVELIATHAPWLTVRYAF